MMRKNLLSAAVLLFAAGMLWSGGTQEQPRDDGNSPVGKEAREKSGAPEKTSAAERPAPVKKSWAGTFPAPEFPEGLEWINVPGPVTMKALEGKIVLLDFWTYGCINCIHNLPFVKKLEKEFPEELVVIGVHSAKFENEGTSAGLRNIVRRYDITYPVVNDRDFAVWKLWGPEAWPTLVLVDPAGKIVGGRSGEGFYDAFKEIILSLREEFGAKGKINRTLPALEAETRSRTVLSFPGKVRVDAEGKRIFIADSGNHRIVAAEVPSGGILDAAGGLEPGFRDGSFEEARFRNPQGMAVSRDGRTLYVADTGNHAVRALDFTARRVVTLAGKGSQSEAYPPEAGIGAGTVLSSPWDLVLRDGTLYIAMAGSHQLWTYELSTGRTRPLAGSGAEGFLDAPGPEAELAQPSGLAFDQAGRLYFADSEGSSIRWVEPAAKDVPVKTLAGSGKSLFEFGLRDGTGREALFQHPLGVAYHEGAVYAADTYNHAIRKIDPGTGAVVTLAGGKPGFEGGRTPRFDEPGGIDAAGGLLYIADTNNHTVRIYDLASGETTALVLKGAEKLAVSRGTSDIVVLKAVSAAPGRGELRLDLRLPAGFKPNGEAPSFFSAAVSGTGVKFTGPAELTAAGPRLPVVFPVELSRGTGTLRIEVSLVYCETGKESLCYLERRVLEVPYAIGGGPSSSIDVVHEVRLEDDRPRGYGKID